MLEPPKDRRVIIDISHLRKVFKIDKERVVALDDVTMRIREGEICCLLGTSGSGKSTLLNLVAGLDRPTSGSVTICGKRVDRLSEKKMTIFRQKNMGFVFQSYNLLPNLTALENVALPLTFRKVRRKKRNALAAESLRAVGLGDRMKHRPTQMSGGQQQRVGIARAFVARPRIVFADEPTGNLDSKTTAEVMAMMIRMCRENNQTMILVTHERDIANYADTVYYMLDGKISAAEHSGEKAVPAENIKDEEVVVNG